MTTLLMPTLSEHTLPYFIGKFGNERSEQIVEFKKKLEAAGFEEQCPGERYWHFIKRVKGCLHHCEVDFMYRTIKFSHQHRETT